MTTQEKSSFNTWWDAIPDDHVLKDSRIPLKTLAEAAYKSGWIDATDHWIKQTNIVEDSG